MRYFFKKTFIIRLITVILFAAMFSSCAMLSPSSNHTQLINEAVDDDNITNQNSQEEKFSFTTEKLHIALIKAFSQEISNENLEEYDLKFQQYLENQFDGTTNYFYTSDRSLTANFTMKESFKIIPQNIYCREYKQHVEYLDEVIDNIGVACRENKNIWKNIVLLTQ